MASRDPVERFVKPVDCCAIFIKLRRALLTEASSGNAAATSGLRRTRLVPFLYSSKYLPLIPLPKSSRLYSLRISSCLTVFIYFPFLSCCAPCAYYSCLSMSLSMNDNQQLTHYGIAKGQKSMLSYRMVGIVERNRQRITKYR